MVFAAHDKTDPRLVAKTATVSWIRAPSMLSKRIAWQLVFREARRTSAERKCAWRKSALRIEASRRDAMGAEMPSKEKRQRKESNAACTRWRRKSDATCNRGAALAEVSFSSSILAAGRSSAGDFPRRAVVERLPKALFVAESVR